MKKSLKIILLIIAITVLLVISGIGALPFLIDPNDFKAEIATAVKNKTGRDLIIDGELKLSLFPWIGISTGRLALSNAPGFEAPFLATLESSNVQVKLLPLLSKRIEVGRIGLNGLNINLVRNPQGIANWSGLTSSKPTSSAAETGSGMQNQKPAPTLAAALVIGGLTLENAHINWEDMETGRRLEIKDFDLNTGQFSFDRPVEIKAALTLSESRSKISQAVEFNTELTVNERSGIYSLRHSDAQLINFPGQSITTALTVADVTLDMNQQTAKISGLQLKSGEMTLLAELTGTSIQDKPLFQGPVAIEPFNPAQVMLQLSINVPAMQDADALSELAVNFDLMATADSADLHNLAIALDDSHIKGTAGIKGFIKPAINFKLDIDAVDADRYLPPADKTSKPIASPAVILAGGLSALPAETLRKLNAEGTVSLGKLTVKGLTMQDIRLDLNSKNGIIGTQQSVKRFYQGQYAGSLSMNAQGAKPMMAVDEKLEHVQIESLLKDYNGSARLSGTVDASAQLQGQGSRAGELIASLNGRLSFLFKNGVIKGFNLQKIIAYKDIVKAPIQKPVLPQYDDNDQTLFSEMRGTATVTNGVIQNNDLVAKSSILRVDGKGNIDLNSEKLDYKVDVKLLDRTTAQPEPAKGNVTINIAGTLSQPSYTIDIASLLTDKNKAKIDKLINKIDKKLDSGLNKLLKDILK